MQYPPISQTMPPKKEPNKTKQSQAHAPAKPVCHQMLEIMLKPITSPSQRPHTLFSHPFTPLFAPLPGFPSYHSPTHPLRISISLSTTFFTPGSM